MVHMSNHGHVADICPLVHDFTDLEGGCGNTVIARGTKLYSNIPHTTKQNPSSITQGHNIRIFSTNPIKLIFKQENSGHFQRKKITVKREILILYKTTVQYYRYKNEPGDVTSFIQLLEIL